MLAFVQKTYGSILAAEHHAFVARFGDGARIRREIVFHNDRDVGRFVAAVRRYAGKGSSGEVRLLLAVCALAE
jgi:hypothetical protein